jgi:activator of 2-hydroxyglutaryl-CoA dehydratase
MTYYIGIDNSSLDHKVHILNDSGKILTKFTVENNLSGFNKLNEVLINLDELRIGLELPHGPLIDYLRDKII